MDITSDSATVTYRRYQRSAYSGWNSAAAQSDGSGRHPAGRSTTYGSLKSTRGVPCRTEFVNRTDVTLRVLWLDFKGEKVEYSVMPPGGTYRGLRTYSTHPWVLEDPQGTVYAVYVGGSATVTVHGRDSFTVVSGVKSPNKAKDSIRNCLVVQHLRKAARNPGSSSPPEVKGDNSSNECNKSMTSSHSNEEEEEVNLVSSEKQHVLSSAVGWLGWCVPKKASATGVKSVQKENSGTSKTETSPPGCSICCDSLEQDVWALACGHMFHGQCLADACEHQLECPVCRQEIAGEADLRRLYPN